MKATCAKCGGDATMVDKAPDGESGDVIRCHARCDMKRDSAIDDKINEIDAVAARLVALWQEVADLAIAEGHEDIAKSAAVAYALRVARDDLPSSITSMRRFLREARRPKGPTVELRWAGNEDREPLTVEVIRRTEKRVLLNNGYRSGTWYDIERGHEVPRPSNVYLGEWRITDAGLATIRAMPVGDNDVSRALKAAKAAR